MHQPLLAKIQLYPSLRALADWLPGDSLPCTSLGPSKVWAKQKIEHLLIRYYGEASGSTTAKEFKDEIIRISLAYGVISPFTRFSGGGTDAVEEPGGSRRTVHPSSYVLLGNYPNPFNPGTTIKFRIFAPGSRTIVVTIYDMQGRLVRRISLDVRGEGDYQVYWNGMNDAGNLAVTGVYFYRVNFGDVALGGRMLLVM